MTVTHRIPPARSGHRPQWRMPSTDDQPAQADGALPPASSRCARRCARLRRRRPHLLLGGRTIRLLRTIPGRCPSCRFSSSPFTMTAPMAAWMLFRGMPRRETVEMVAVMPVLAIALLALGWLALVPMSDSRAARARADDAGDARSDVFPTRPLHGTARTCRPPHERRAPRAMAASPSIAPSTCTGCRSAPVATPYG